MVKDFPLLAMEKIIKKAGAERVSASAAKELRIVASEIAEKIAKDAVEMAHHAKRVTVKKEDIILASKR
jgi:histone H3/H4